MTDHNRTQLEVSYNRIEQRTRTASGAMRKYYVADKRNFSFSFEDLPSKTSETVDGYWGGDDLESFFTSTTGSFTLTIQYDAGNTEDVTVVFNSFQPTLKYRWKESDYIDLSIELEEV